jgi:hypothetical protein
MTSVTLFFVDERQILTVIQPMLPLHEFADPAPAESADESLHSVGDFGVVEESAVEPLHSADDPGAAESTVEPLQSVADSDVAAVALTETSCS